MLELRDVLECLEHDSEEITHYYNKKDETIIYVIEESETKYNGRDDYDLASLEEWEVELIMGLRDFENNKENYIELPKVDERTLMLEFLEMDLNSDKTIGELRETLKGDKMLMWYDFREEREEDIVKNWLLENNIIYKN